MKRLFTLSKLMNFFSLVILVLLFAHPVHATSFTITDGIYDPIFGPSSTVTGSLELWSGGGGPNDDLIDQEDVFGGYSIYRR